MELILVRHGPTEWNALDRFQGRSDIPLSDEGRAVAAAIAAALRDEEIDRIYSSDLIRASETARIIADAREMCIVTEPRLCEFDFGRWEGLTWEEIVATDPASRRRAPTAANLYAPKGGETFAQVRRRVESFLDDLPIEDRDARILIVTHAGPLHAFLSVLGLTQAGEAAAQLDRFSRGSITRITIGGDGVQLIGLNELNHLDAAR